MTLTGAVVSAACGAIGAMVTCGILIAWAFADQWLRRRREDRELTDTRRMLDVEIDKRLEAENMLIATQNELSRTRAAMRALERGEKNA